MMHQENSYIKLSIVSIVVVAICCSWIPVDFLTTIERNYTEQRKAQPYVSLSLTFNQSKYIGGDTVFFAARYNYENRQIVKGTNLLRLDLVSSEGITVQSTRFKVTDGVGYNQLVIKNDLKEGVYRFVAYSDWMRNFGQESYFYQNIEVLSRQQFEPISNTIYGQISFYPEGGKLISDIENRILVKGNPNSEIVIRDNFGVEAASVTINSLGIATFNFTPKSDHQYSVLKNSALIQSKLPPIEKDGVGIILQSDLNEVVLSAPKNSKILAEDTYALILSNGEIIKKDQLRFNSDGKVTLKLPRHSPQEIYYQLYILDSNAREIAQRIFLLHGEKMINSELKIIETPLQQDSVTLLVNVNDTSGKSIIADLSFSIVQDSLFSGSQNFNQIQFSEVPSVMNWMNDVGAQSRKHLNEFLIAEKFNRVNWSNIYYNKSVEFKFPFQSLLRFKGRALSNVDNKPSEDSTLVISYLQKNAMGYEAYTKDGYFDFPVVYDFWGDDDIFITLRNKKGCIDDEYRIEFIEDTVLIKESWKSISKRVDDRYADYAIKKKLIQDSYSFYGRRLGQEKENFSPNEILEEEFQGADYTMNVADFVVFPSMEDLLREVVTFVQLRKKGDDMLVRLFYRYEKSVVFYKDDPLYVIDGVMSTSTESFLNLRPEDLLSIKIINNPNKLSQLGNLGENGIVFVESRKGNLTKNFRRNIFSVTGLSAPKRFDNKENIKTEFQRSTPDLRSNLLWVPFTKITELNKGALKLRVKLSDDIGVMRLNIHGITNDRIYFTSDNVFSVGMNNERK